MYATQIYDALTNLFRCSFHWCFFFTNRSRNERFQKSTRGVEWLQWSAIWPTFLFMLQWSRDTKNRFKTKMLWNTLIRLCLRIVLPRKHLSERRSTARLLRKCCIWCWVFFVLRCRSHFTQERNKPKMLCNPRIWSCNRKMLSWLCSRYWSSVPLSPVYVTKKQIITNICIFKGGRVFYVKIKGVIFSRRPFFWSLLQSCILGITNRHSEWALKFSRKKG